MQRRATFFVCALPGRRRYCRQGRGNFFSADSRVYMPCNNNMTTVELFKSPVVKR